MAYIDLNLSYTHSARKVDGIETTSNPNPGSAVSKSDGYSANVAWYVWEYTAIEMNYSRTTQRLIDDREVATADDSITIKEVDSTVVTEVAGAGIRQAFAKRNSAIIPSISIGYAKYTTSGLSRYTLDDSGTEKELEIEQDKEIFSSSYASISIRLRITQLISFTLAAKTIMPDFDTSLAENNVTYSAGFSWIF
jgi:hypothetical protein